MVNIKIIWSSSILFDIVLNTSQILKLEGHSTATLEWYAIKQINPMGSEELIIIKTTSGSLMDSLRMGRGMAI
jgi:hypothetical protein